MSTVFYIVNKKNKNELIKFNQFLETYKEKIKNELTEYVKNENGTIINEDKLEYDIDRKTSEFINALYYSVDEDEIRFGQYSVRGFHFFCDFTCSFLRNIDDVKKYLLENPDCVIMDEYDEEYSIEKLEKIIKTGFMD